MNFWILSAILTLAVVLILFRPLRASASRAGENPGVTKGLNRTLILVLFLAFPAGVLALYSELGSPGLPDMPLSSRSEEIAQHKEYLRFNDMTDRLAERLKGDPDNMEAWAMLARSYRVLNRLDESIKTYDRIHKKDPKNTGVTLEYGETLVMSHEGHFSDEAKTLFQHAVASDPENYRARFYLGLAEAQSGAGLPNAVKIWEKLEKDLPEETPWKPSLKEQLDAARKMLNTATG